MSLRLRLFLGLSGLVAVMVTAQWWWVRGLTRELSDEVRDVAFTVGHSMAAILADDLEECPENTICGQEGESGRVFVRHLESPFSFGSSYSSSSAASGAASPSPKPAAPPAFDVVVATPPQGEVFTFRTRQGTGDPARKTVESGTAWVGVRPEDGPPSWIRVPEGARSVHWIGSDDEAREQRKVRLARRFTEADGEARTIVLSLDMDVEDSGDASATATASVGERGWLQRNFFFSADDAAQAGYITVAATGDAVSRSIPIPSRGLNEKLEDFRRRMLWGSLAIFGVGLALSALVAQRVSAPLRRLSEAAHDVGEGSFGRQVPVSASGEVGRAIHAFNRMSSELESYDRKTRQLQAREHLGEIGEIARGLAHTLRNPLNALGLSVEELAAQAPATAAGLAGSARRQIRRIDQSIRSFLALASQGGGVISEVDPGELVQDVALEALQDGRGRVRLAVDAAADAPSLRAVEPELRAVLQALLVNAVEASPEGGTVAIRVASSAAADRVLIEVEDDGPGLPEAVRGRLFTPHLTTKANGSGMGLFLAHRIATNRYGGRLALEDREEGGTRAVLEIGPRNQELDHG